MRITFSEKSKNVGTDPQKYASSTKTSYLAISDGSVGMGALLRPLCQNCQVGLRDLPGWSEVGPGKIRTNPRTSTRIPKKYASSPKTSYWRLQTDQLVWGLSCARLCHNCQVGPWDLPVGPR